MTRLFDLDGDGDLDALSQLTWFENYDGHGNFLAHEIEAAGAGDSLAADLDNDGDLDLVNVNRHWYENDGHGRFTEHSLDENTQSFARLWIFDLGGDGDLDVVGFTASEAHLYENGNGDRAFSEAAVYDLPSNAVDAGDFDLDGHLDILAFEHVSHWDLLRADPTPRDVDVSIVWLYRDSGNGELDRQKATSDGILSEEFPQEMPGTNEWNWFLEDLGYRSWIRRANFADVDGDRDPDIVLMSHDKESEFREWVWLENVEGQFSLPAAPLGRSSFGDLFPRDIDRDGDLDAFTLDDLSEDVDWYINDNGTFSRAGNVSFHFHNFGRNITDVGDINRDGIYDVVVGFQDGLPSWIDGVTGEPHEPGTAIDSPDPSPFTFVARPLGKSDGRFLSAVADLSGNGTADLIVADTSIEFWEDGHGLREIATDLAFVERVEAADMDGDGDSDIVFENRDFLAWIENLGDNRFGRPQTITVPSRFNRLRYWELGDINQDGLVDLVTATRGAGVFGGSSLSLRINAGNSFQAMTIPSRGETVRALIIADVDGDQDLDVFAHIGYWRGRGRIYENIWFENENGKLGNEETLKTSSTGLQSLYSEDVNDDGRADLIVVSYEGVSWRDGFSGIARTITEEEPPVSFVDVDDDGDLDLASHVGNRLVWYQNQDGEGEFSDEQTLGTALLSSGIHVADYTGDGRADLIVTHRDGRITLLEKRTTGDSNHDGVFNSSDLVAVFQRAEYEDGTHRNSTFETGDWNGDGEFDSTDIVFAFQAGTFVTAARESNLGSSGSDFGVDDENANKARSFVA